MWLFNVYDMLYVYMSSTLLTLCFEMNYFLCYVSLYMFVSYAYWNYDFENNFCQLSQGHLYKLKMGK